MYCSHVKNKKDIKSYTIWEHTYLPNVFNQSGSNFDLMYNLPESSLVHIYTCDFLCSFWSIIFRSFISVSGQTGCIFHCQQQRMMYCVILRIKVYVIIFINGRSTVCLVIVVLNMKIIDLCPQKPDFHLISCYTFIFSAVKTSTTLLWLVMD